MFKMFSWPVRARQLAAARTVLSHLAEALDARCRCSSGMAPRVPLGRGNVDGDATIAIRGPGVIGSLLRWPTLDNLVRHYATGQIEVHGGDLIEFFEAARVERSRDG